MQGGAKRKGTGLLQELHGRERALRASKADPKDAPQNQSASKASAQRSAFTAPQLCPFVSEKGPLGTDKRSWLDGGTPGDLSSSAARLGAAVSGPPPAGAVLPSPSAERPQSRPPSS